MARILILQQDLPHSDSEISTGGGIRAHALGEGLRQKGHELFYAIPRVLFDHYSMKERVTEGLLWHSPGNIDHALNSSRPDVILLQWLGSCECLRYIHDIPVVIDLVAPRLFELYHRGHPLEWEVQAKIDALTMGDFFTCSNQRQWYYFLPWLMFAGESNVKDLLAVVPVSAPFRPQVKKRSGETIFLWGGVQWPWNNPLPFLNIVSDEIRESGKGKLIVISGKFPYPYGAGTQFLDWAEELRLHSRVEMRPLLPYREMVEVYHSCSVAIDISEDLPERRLASPFRTKDYLSCGLPLITADFMEIAPFIEEHRAGWVVNAGDKEAYREQVRWLLHNPDKVEDFGLRARRLAQRQFSFETAVEPLHRFCLNPRKRAERRSLFSVIINLNHAKRLSDSSFDSEAMSLLEKEEELVERELERLHYQKGLIYLKKGDLTAAKREFLEEERLFPGRVSVQLRLSRIRLYEGCKPEVLVKPTQELLRVYPGEENVRYELAFLYYLLMDTKNAEILFKEEVFLFGGKYLKMYTLGSELKREGFYSEALLYFKGIVSGASTLSRFIGGSHYHMGEIYYDLAEREKAIVNFKKCLEKIPSHKKALEYLGRLKK